jgi:hypothetical protein
MKLSTTLILASIAGTSAFMAPSVKQTFVVRQMSEDPIEPLPELMSEEVVSEPSTPALPEMSQSLPFMARPAMLDGSIAGDAGFDPFGFAKSEDDLMNYREAEIKHARLAMLAAAGWPISELFDRKIANLIGMTPIVDADALAPSIFNGGLGKISPVYWAAVIIGAGAIDLYGISKSKSNSPDYFPGNLGFDPLGLYPKEEAGRQRMQLAEIKNGRLGMIAITAFAFQELVQQVGVVDKTPIFFKPIGEVIQEYTNSGYISH